MKVTYNAQITLTFSFLAVLILYIDQKIYPGIISTAFTLEGNRTFSFSSLESYFRLFTYVFGHRDWEHLSANLMFILLLGPALEEKFGTSTVFRMMIITALVGGIVNILFISTPLLGCSGIVFMMIILTSFANIQQGQIPLSFFLVLLLYLWKEIQGAFVDKDISQVSHVLGGICGVFFGFTKKVLK
ncbi:MAG: rhomboid family intramembrane serine protease [Spirochaetia bacterium]